MAEPRAYGVSINEDEEFEKLTQQRDKQRAEQASHHIVSTGKFAQLQSEPSHSRQVAGTAVQAHSANTAKTTPAKVFHSQLKKQWSMKKLMHEAAHADEQERKRP